MQTQTNSPHKRHPLVRQVHPNRNLFYAIALIVIAGILLIGYILVSNENFSNSFIFSSTAQRKLFIDSGNGYQVRYPATWVLEHDEGGNMLFENPSDASEGIAVAVVPAGFDTTLRANLSITAERDYTHNGLSIALLTINAGPSNPALQGAIIKSSSHTYFVTGNSSYFNAFIQNFSDNSVIAPAPAVQQ